MNQRYCPGHEMETITIYGNKPADVAYETHFCDGCKMVEPNLDPGCAHGDNNQGCGC